ncbi:hypothetical protein PPROV_000518000 [Pycnococcus provasolii]|uniref:SAC3/GANP/THP3 conserved domain-containing protein n=1 Tax=Pycnococcus provasolii TaxID=41880 RepID=A0A830HI06_9CHLO|nr:hypothetical protein PPROV_000518000 [Pycnococcus provasolii]
MQWQQQHASSNASASGATNASSYHGHNRAFGSDAAPPAAGAGAGAGPGGGRGATRNNAFGGTGFGAAAVQNSNGMSGFGAAGGFAPTGFGAAAVAASTTSGGGGFGQKASSPVGFGQAGFGRQQQGGFGAAAGSPPSQVASAFGRAAPGAASASAGFGRQQQGGFGAAAGSPPTQVASAFGRAAPGAASASAGFGRQQQGGFGAAASSPSKHAARQQQGGFGAAAGSPSKHAARQQQGGFGAAAGSPPTQVASAFGRAAPGAASASAGFGRQQQGGFGAAAGSPPTQVASAFGRAAPGAASAGFGRQQQGGFGAAAGSPPTQVASGFGPPTTKSRSRRRAGGGMEMDEAGGGDASIAPPTDYPTDAKIVHKARGKAQAASEGATRPSILARLGSRVGGDGDVAPGVAKKATTRRQSAVSPQDQKPAQKRAAAPATTVASESAAATDDGDADAIKEARARRFRLKENAPAVSAARRARESRESSAPTRVVPPSEIAPRKVLDDGAMDANPRASCTDMCPAEERDKRERLDDIARFEMAQAGNRGLTDVNLAVKKFTRFVENDIPASSVRTIRALYRTMDHLATLMDATSTHCGTPVGMYDIHKFLWDRYRSVRQDLLLQSAPPQHVAPMVEEMVRFQLMAEYELCEVDGRGGRDDESGDDEKEVDGEAAPPDTEAFNSHLNVEQIMKCFTTLQEMYRLYRSRLSEIDRDTTMSGENEMLAFILLLNIDTHGKYKHNPMNTMSLLRQMPHAASHSADVRFARRVYQANLRSDYVTFFRCVESAPYVAACILHLYFQPMRLKAFRMIEKATLPQKDAPKGRKLQQQLTAEMRNPPPSGQPSILRDLVDILYFDDERDLLRHYANFLKYEELLANGGPEAGEVPTFLRRKRSRRLDAKRHDLSRRDITVSAKTTLREGRVAPPRVSLVTSTDVAAPRRVTSSAPAAAAAASPAVMGEEMAAATTTTAAPTIEDRIRMQKERIERAEERKRKAKARRAESAAAEAAKTPPASVESEPPSAEALSAQKKKRSSASLEVEPTRTVPSVPRATTTTMAPSAIPPSDLAAPYSQSPAAQILPPPAFDFSKPATPPAMPTTTAQGGLFAQMPSVSAAELPSPAPAVPMPQHIVKAVTRAKSPEELEVEEERRRLLLLYSEEERRRHLRASAEAEAHAAAVKASRLEAEVVRRVRTLLLVRRWARRARAIVQARLLDEKRRRDIKATNATFFAPSERSSFEDAGLYTEQHEEEEDDLDYDEIDMVDEEEQELEEQELELEQDEYDGGDAGHAIIAGLPEHAPYATPPRGAHGSLADALISATESASAWIGVEQAIKVCVLFAADEDESDPSSAIFAAIAWGRLRASLTQGGDEQLAASASSALLATLAESEQDDWEPCGDVWHLSRRSWPHVPGGSVRVCITALDIRRSIAAGGAMSAEVRARLDGAHAFLHVDGSLAGAKSGGADAVLASLRLLGEADCLSYSAPFLALLEGSEDVSERTASIFLALETSGAAAAERSFVPVVSPNEDGSTGELTDLMLTDTLEAGLTWLSMHGAPQACFPAPLRASPLAVAVRAALTAAMSDEVKSGVDVRARVATSLSALASSLKSTADRFAGYPFQESDALSVGEQLSWFPRRAEWIDANHASSAAISFVAGVIKDRSAAASSSSIADTCQKVASDVEDAIEQLPELVYLDDASVREACESNPWPLARKRRHSEGVPAGLGALSTPSAKRRAAAEMFQVRHAATPTPAASGYRRRRMWGPPPSSILWNELVGGELLVDSSSSSSPVAHDVADRKGGGGGLLDELRAERARNAEMDEALALALL